MRRAGAGRSVKVQRPRPEHSTRIPARPPGAAPSQTRPAQARFRMDFTAITAPNPHPPPLRANRPRSPSPTRTRVDARPVRVRRWLPIHGLSDEGLLHLRQEGEPEAAYLQWTRELLDDVTAVLAAPAGAEGAVGALVEAADEAAG